jgi:sugar phosphate isomerase/epimerase
LDQESEGAATNTPFAAPKIQILALKRLTMKRYSYQLYSSRNFGPLPATLKMLGEMGYAQVEGFGGLYDDPANVDALKAGLTENGLSMPTSHLALEVVEATPDKAIELAKSLGVEHVFVPFLMPDDRPLDDDGWRAFGARLDAAGAPLRAAGLGFGWHNHDFEFVATPSGAMPLDLIMEGGPNLSLELDAAWVVRGGQDPAVYMERYTDRLTAVHVKDIAQVGECADEDGWADVGHGTIDWNGLLAKARATSAQYFVMEHDNPSDDKRFAERSLASVGTY